MFHHLNIYELDILRQGNRWSICSGARWSIWSDFIWSITATFTKKYPNLKQSEIEIAINKFDRSLVRGCVIYCPIVGNQQLWTYADIRGFLVISINTEHEFYKNIIALFREANFEEALTAIELFISSLAWEQREHFDIDETKKRNLDNFRTYVGIHLSNYLQENDIRISKVTIDEFETSLVKEPDAS